MSFPYIVRGKVKLAASITTEILIKNDYVITKVVSNEKECHLLIKRGSEQAYEETVKIDQLRHRELVKKYPTKLLYSVCIAMLFNRISEDTEEF